MHGTRADAKAPKSGTFWVLLRLFTAFAKCKNTPFAGGVFVYVRRCPTFPPGLGSIIGADRLSFRVRDGTGRFPVAVAAVTLFKFVLVAGCGVQTTITPYEFE